MSRIAFIGSRDFNDLLKATEIFQSFIKHYNIKPSLIVSGGAKGADTIGELISNIEGINKLIFPADWKKFGKKAGHIRNTDIINNSDYVLAFWNEKSTGTKNSIEKALKRKIPICVYNFERGTIEYDYKFRS